MYIAIFLIKNVQTDQQQKTVQTRNDSKSL